MNPMRFAALLCVLALLLAGVRATILFDQVGGRRWRLLFQRGKYVEGAQRLLRQA